MLRPGNGQPGGSRASHGHQDPGLMNPVKQFGLGKTFVAILIFGLVAWILTARQIHHAGRRGMYHSNPKSVLAGPHAPPCLFAVVPTIPRRANGILSRTVRDFEETFSKQPFLCGHLSVVNLRQKQHKEFAELKKEYKGDEFFDFYSPSRSLTEPSPTVLPGNKAGKWRATTPGDIRQNQDMIQVLWTAHTHVCRADRNPRGYFMLMEDDVSLCPNALYHIQYFLHRVSLIARDTPQGDDDPDGGGGGDDDSSSTGDAVLDDEGHRIYVPRHANITNTVLAWTMLRASFGMNGVFLKCSDVPALVHYLKTHLHDGPVDYVLPEFWNKKGPEGESYFQHNEPRFVYRYNLFKHRGTVSTFQGRTEGNDGGFHRRYHECYDTLRSLLHPDDMYDSNCGLNDLAPCGDPLLPSSTGWVEAEDQISQNSIEQDEVQPYLLDPHHAVTRQVPVYFDPQPHARRSFRVLVGATGESCTAVCQRANLHCDERYLREVNNCKTLQQYAKCPICTIAGGQELAHPSFRTVTSNNMDVVTCEVAPILSLVTCDGVDSSARVCGCIAGQTKSS